MNLRLGTVWGEPEGLVRGAYGKRGTPMDVGLRGAPPRSQPAPPPPRDPGRAAAPIALLCLVALAAVAWVTLGGLSAAPAVSPAEASFAVRAFAVNRFGFAAAALPWYDGGLGALQVAGYETVTGALRRSATAVVAAREATAVAALVSAIALTLGARRLRLSGPATVAVPILFGLAPAAVLLHRTADPAQLGVLWACIALALAGGEARRTGAAVGSLLYLAAAAVSSPLVLVALVPLFTTLLASGDLGRLRGPWRWVVVVAGVAVELFLIVLAVRGDLTGGRSVAPPPVTALDVVLAAAAVAAGVAGLRVRWLRGLAISLLAVAVTAAVAADIRGSLLVVGLPLAAVVLPAALDIAFARVRVRVPGRLPVAVVTAAAVLAALAWVPSARVLDRDENGTGARERSALDSARAWVVDNLPSRPKLAVDDAVWASLVDAGYPAGRLAAAGGLGPAGAGLTDRSAAAYVVGHDPALLDEATVPAVRDARQHSVPVATFGTGNDQVQVRRVLSGADAEQQARRDAAGRVSAGTALTGNQRLTLSPGAEALMRAGRVDARALAVLAALTGQHAISVTDFPAVAGEDPQRPRRLIAVGAIDGEQIRAGAERINLLDRWLRAQQPPYRPAGTSLSTVDGKQVLLVRYDALGATGLLPP